MQFREEGEITKYRNQYAHCILRSIFRSLQFVVSCDDAEVADKVIPRSEYYNLRSRIIPNFEKR